jgi:hypothetical protein
MIKSRIMGWEGHVTRMGKKIGAYKVLVGKSDRRRTLGRPRLRGKNTFLFNNQPDALINQTDCHKTLHVSGIFSAHHQEFSTVNSALVSFMLKFL